jgi:ribosomal protein S30
MGTKEGEAKDKSLELQSERKMQPKTRNRLAAKVKVIKCAEVRAHHVWHVDDHVDVGAVAVVLLPFSHQGRAQAYFAPIPSLQWLTVHLIHGSPSNTRTAHEASTSHPKCQLDSLVLALLSLSS